MKKLIIILLILLFISNRGDAQNFDIQNVTERKIEVLAYASVELMPDDVYVSFVIKEYNDGGKNVSLEESVSAIKKIIIEIGCNPEDLNPGNIYGYTSTQGDGTAVFQHKVQYVLRLNSIDCAHEFVNRVNKLAIESFSIDEMNAKIQDVLFRKLQSEAFLNAKEKADLFLSIFDEKSGKVIELREVNANFTFPSFYGNGKTKKSISPVNGINYFESKSENTKNVKFEYVAKVIFEIK